MSGRLTTHVLELSGGRPAAGMRVALYRMTPEGAVKLREATTNADGRLDAPLLAGGDLLAGTYELVFDVGDWYSARQTAGGASVPTFLEQVPVRFRIADGQEHYHVPLLVAPGGYSTYRGS
ncbi:MULTISPECIES: hydroxyisourate hydrolase [Paenibacillus]|uniref:5-hydroxyisourate hydrolase n=1 Tax=Paenibacillus validus TaxID=44253 RepID=A0A7X3CT56_9BACL|nr:MULTISPECIES: hydroxyisourate hydrolase [Paenibacillus]MUG70737.1 hydroxyisourate hydrolase [Paenibacillus validus]